MSLAVIDSITIGNLTVSKWNDGRVRFEQAGKVCDLWSNVTERERVFEMLKAASQM
jgi:hypothetical protein